MHWLRSSLAVVSTAMLVSSCSDTSGPGTGGSLNCTAANLRVLAVGENQVIDPIADGACVRLPAAGGAGAEHLYVPLATEGQEDADGVSAPYSIAGASAGADVVSAFQSPLLSAFRRPLAPEVFHNMLRARERALSQSPSVALFSQGRASAAAVAPPVLGEVRTFQVCANSSCDSFVASAARARSIGARVAIFVDTLAPAGGYDTSDLDNVQGLFDDFLYPIDTTAFGHESDVDANGVVVVLLTQHVNALSPDCNATQRVILGYFFGADLLPAGASNPGSNEAEVFYGLVPDVANLQCTISKDEATSRLPATFIHEFQHMISFNQHVLVRDGNAESTWLNEGLSHFAEELGGRQVPDVECPAAPSCAQEFIEGDLVNAFAYLASPEEFFLIEPGNSTGLLEERGANWLFVRWLADHFASDTVLGTDFTRRLVATNQTGSNNVAAQTAEDFSALVGQWQLANYLDDLPGFSEPTGRLRYKSWNFREVADSTHIPFPLDPDSTSGTGYSHTGVLRAGSGQHVRVVQGAGAGGVDLKVTSSSGGALPAAIKPRIALVRVR